MKRNEVIMFPLASYFLMLAAPLNHFLCCCCKACLVLLGGPLVASKEMMSLSGQLFVARLKVRKYQAYQLNRVFQIPCHYVVLALRSLTSLPSSFHLSELFIWSPLASFPGFGVVFCRCELGERNLCHRAQHRGSED